MPVRSRLVPPAAALAVLLAVPVAAQPAPRVVVGTGAAGRLPEGARRAVAVAVDVEGLAAAARIGQTVAVEVFGQTFVVALERVAWRGPDGLTWFGAVEGGGRATLTVEASHMVGRIVTPAGVVMIEPADQGHVAYEPGPFPETPDDALPAPPDAAPRGAGTEVLFPDELHIALFYTQPVASGLGAGLAAFLQANEDALNDVLANSEVPLRARIVHTGLVDYTESTDMGTDLARLRATADGFMDEVHATRTAVSADLVALLVQTAPSACGIGYLMTNVGPGFATSAFTVTRRSCAVGNLTFPHEVGHNLGLHHDTYVATPGSASFPYSHGFVNDDSLGVTPGRPGIRTTLAYNNECADQGGTCIRVPYFSGPDLTFGGQVLGDSATAHNARSVAFSIPVAATFRAPVLLTATAGDTGAGAVWQRPACPDPRNLATCVLADSARFTAHPVHATAAGRYYLRATAAHDGVLLLYAGAFDPAAPLAGLVGYAEPDTTAPEARRLLLGHAIAAGATYTLVVTGRTTADAGPFALDVFGPAGAGVVVPAEGAPGAATGVVLGRAAPNPFHDRATLSLVLDTRQRVEAAAYDALGRRVAVLHDGPLAAGTHALTLDGADLAPGVYMVRVRGEGFAAAQRVTRLP